MICTHGCEWGSCCRNAAEEASIDGEGSVGYENNGDWIRLDLPDMNRGIFRTLKLHMRAFHVPPDHAYIASNGHGAAMNMEAPSVGDGLLGPFRTMLFIEITTFDATPQEDWKAGPAHHWPFQFGHIDLLEGQPLIDFIRERLFRLLTHETLEVIPWDLSPS